MIRVEDSVKALSYIIGGLGFLPVAAEIGLSYSLGFVALSCAALVFEVRAVHPVPRWLLNTASLALIGATFTRITLQDFVTPVVEALLLLLAIKFLEEKKFRDYMQIYMLAVFLLAGSALLSLDILFLVYLVALIFLLAVAMVLLTYHAQDKDLELPLTTIRDIVLKSLFIPVLSIPLAAVLFVVLPRTNFPAFSALSRGGGASSGFSDNVRLGQVSSIQEDAAVIMRVEMEKTDEAHLYWRGIVLDHFDGVSWKSSRRKGGEGAPVPLVGRRIAQTIYLDPYENSYVFVLERPLLVRARDVRQYDDATFALPGMITKKLKYEALSVLSDTLPSKTVDLDRYLQLPEKGLEKIREVALATANRGSAEEDASAILGFLRDGEYRYSLSDLPVSSAPLDEFLFSHKSGNCEYFASAMAVFLRLSGIPARLVGGYRGGFYNEAGNYYMIPQKNAHVWVEAYFEGRGWVRLDPTPFGVENYVSPSGKSVLFRIRLFFDAINYYWNAFVINYDLEKQFSLARKLGEGFRDFRIDFVMSRDKAFHGLVLIFIIGCIGLAGYVLARARKPMEEKLLAAFLKGMKKRGYAKTGSQGLEEFAAAVGDDAIREKALRFAELFERFYYRDRRPTDDEAQRLRRITREL
jgi:transglutaminase-like putative cysteine protease